MREITIHIELDKTGSNFYKKGFLPKLGKCEVFKLSNKKFDFDNKLSKDKI